jgi:Na+-translocating ferredoxin:NAD+ oxidoreductase RNF subunit RnfB
LDCEGEKVVVSTKQKIWEIYEALPKLNRGFCEFAGCGQFVRAVTGEELDLLAAGKIFGQGTG